MKGRPKKEFHEYIVASPGGSHISHAEYRKEPATAFLRYVVEAKSSVDLCLRKFKANNAYSTDAVDSIRHISVAMLPAIMGHFETYQRYFFAGAFENSIYLDSFDIDCFFKKIEKHSGISIDLIRLSAYRGGGSGFSAGIIIADSLSGWHSPDKVNKYFAAFGLPVQVFGNDDSKRLKVLWQLRHSIVHTGGTITLPDSQKIAELSAHAGETVAFENNFIYEVARKMHPLIKLATNGFGGAYKAALKANTPTSVSTVIDELFSVRSSVNVWLR
jgi:hypothetical protein